MIGAWSRLTDEEHSAAWDRFNAKFSFAPTGGEPTAAIVDPSPSVTFDLRGIWDAQRPGFSEASVAAIEAAARRSFLSELGEDVELVVLDWQHESFRLRPAADGFDVHPGVVPDGDYYIYATEDFGEGTFGHPWEMSLCVFGSRMVRSLGGELRTWLPVLRETAMT